MDNQPNTIWGRESAMVFALVQAVIALVVAFGLDQAPDQIGAILAVTAVVLGLITRSRVSPASSRDGYLRGTLPWTPTARQVDVLAAFVASGGSVAEAAAHVGVRPSIAKRHLADLRAGAGLTTEQLIYLGRAEGWLGGADSGAQLNPRPAIRFPAGPARRRRG